MAFDAKTSLCGWFLLLVLAILLWYRNTSYDRIYGVYALLIGLILLIFYGVHSGMDPLTAGRLAIFLVFIFVVILFTLIYSMFGSMGMGIISLVAIFVFFYLMLHVLMSDFRIDITCQSWEPAYWISSQTNMFIYALILIGLIFPLIFLLARSGWSVPELYIAIVFMIITFSICVAHYKSTQALSVWFYLLTILILFFWIWGMFVSPKSKAPAF